MIELTCMLMLPCLHAFMLSCFHAFMLTCLHAHAYMFTFILGFSYYVLESFLGILTSWVILGLSLLGFLFLGLFLDSSWVILTWIILTYFLAFVFSWLLLGGLLCQHYLFTPSHSPVSSARGCVGN